MSFCSLFSEWDYANMECEKGFEMHFLTFTLQKFWEVTEDSSELAFLLKSAVYYTEKGL